MVPRIRGCINGLSIGVGTNSQARISREKGLDFEKNNGCDLVYLMLQGHIRQNWKTRWFVLKKSSLEYYKTRQVNNWNSF